MTDIKDETKVAGGIARAKALSAAERKAIAQKAAASRWAGNIPKATHDGVIKLGELEIECAVLEDGRRVISERAMTRAFGGKRGGSHWKRAREGGANLPVYLSARNFSPFISNDLAMALSAPITDPKSSALRPSGGKGHFASRRSAPPRRIAPHSRLCRRPGAAFSYTERDR